MKEYKEEKQTLSDGSIIVKYTKQYHNCFCCNRKTHISKIKTLQNDYFINTIVSKKLCLICNKEAKRILEEAKPQLKSTKWYRDK